MVERLDGLWHDAVVGGHDQDDDVGDLGAPGAHGGEGLVAGGVDEGDQLAVVVDLVGADVLGDPAGLAGHDVGLADPVQEERLAVVDVAHDGHDRRAGPEQGLVLLLVVEVLGLQLRFLLLAGVDEADVGVQLGGEQLDHVVRQGLGGGDHLALLEEEPHHVGARAVELRAQLLGGRPRSTMISPSGTGALEGV